MEMSSFNRLSIWLELVFHFVFGAAGCLLSEGGKHSTLDISLAEKEIASVSAGTQVNMRDACSPSGCFSYSWPSHPPCGWKCRASTAFQFGWSLSFILFLVQPAACFPKVESILHSLAEKEIASVSAGTQVNMYMLICR